MSKGQQLHIESLSVTDFIDHVNSQFIQYAACGVFRLGKLNDMYVVLNRSSKVIFSSGFASNALKAYISEIKNNAS